MKNIKITISSDVDGESMLENIKAIGVANATLSGNVISGSAAGNLVNPLRSVPGVSSVELVEGQEDNPQPTRNPDVPNLTPVPGPTPSKVDSPSVQKWSGLEEKH